MKIDELIKELQITMPQIVNSYCIVNGSLMSLNELQRMGFKEFSLRSKINMPKKLYKYFPNTLTSIVDKNTGEIKTINYSLEALKNNTIFLQSPRLYDDIYDSDINLDFSDYERLRLLEYCKRCSVEVNEQMSTFELGNLLLKTLDESFKFKGNINSIFKRTPSSKIEDLSNQCFIKKINIYLQKSNNLTDALINTILSDYNEYLLLLQNTFRTACFTTTPYSQLMWGGSYANCHNGFCVEYTISPNDSKYAQVFLNLFPMIYCTVRPNMAEKLTKIENSPLTDDDLWDIYFNGALRKSIDWAYQNEWRLLFPPDNHLKENGYNINFFPITKVFLGNRMSGENQKEIIKICLDRKIPYVGIIRSANTFEMKETEIKTL